MRTGWEGAASVGLRNLQQQQQQFVSRRETTIDAMSPWDSTRWGESTVRDSGSRDRTFAIKPKWSEGQRPVTGVDLTRFTALGSIGSVPNIFISTKLYLLPARHESVPRGGAGERERGGVMLTKFCHDPIVSHSLLLQNHGVRLGIESIAKGRF
jgi:hypothetical protein